MPMEPLNSIIRIWKEAEALLALFRWFRVPAERKLTEFARNACAARMLASKHIQRAKLCHQGESTLLRFGQELESCARCQSKSGY